MSTITIMEKTKLEKLFGMRSGYVSNLSDATFGDFLAEAVDIDIHDAKYQDGGASKAKKFRQFWQLESDYIVGKAILALVKREEEILVESASKDPEKKALIEPCKSIAHRLMSADVTLDDLKRAAAAFDARHLMDQIRRMESSVHQDPALAIGTAKELIETCCKTILSERGKPVKGTPDIPALTKETLKELNLVPEGVTDSVRGSDTIKRIRVFFKIWALSVMGLRNFADFTGRDMANTARRKGSGRGTQSWRLAPLPRSSPSFSTLTWRIRIPASRRSTSDGRWHADSG